MFGFIEKINSKLRRWYRNLPEGKKYMEFVASTLSIPVLITVLLLNLSTINSNRPKEETNSSPQRIIVASPTNQPQPSVAQEACKKQVGPISIVSPRENETVTEDPLCLNISYTVGEFCSVAWQYRINGGQWSDFTDKSICIYNMPSGNKKLELRAKSIASSDEKVLERNFIYKSSNPSPTPATSSALFLN